MKKHRPLYYIVFIAIIVSSFMFVHTAKVAQACTSTNSNYCLLAPLPGLGDSVDTTQGVGSYINVLIKITIGLISVLAVVMLVVGGIEYMVSNIAGEKASAKSRMTNAIFGLILMLSSYLILNTINPKLVNLSVGIAPTTLKNFDNTKAGQDGMKTTHIPKPKHLMDQIILRQTHRLRVEALPRQSVRILLRVKICAPRQIMEHHTMALRMLREYSILRLQYRLQIFRLLLEDAETVLPHKALSTILNS